MSASILYSSKRISFHARYAFHVLAVSSVLGGGLDADNDCAKDACRGPENFRHGLVEIRLGFANMRLSTHAIHPMF